MVSSPITNTSADSNIGAVSTRNAILSGISVSTSVVVFVLVAVTTNIKKPIKITLLNLLASDIALMLNGLMYAMFVQTKLTSSHSLCMVTIFWMINGFFLSHTAVAAISFNNYIAIFYPFKHNIYVTTKSVSVGVVVVWLSLCLISGSCIIVNFPTNEPCVVLSNIPRYGAIVVFSVLFLMDFSVIVMNASLCVVIRKRKRVHQVNTVFAVTRNNQNRWAQKRSSIPPPLPQPLPHDDNIPDAPVMETGDGLNEDSTGKNRGANSSNLSNVMSRRNDQLRLHETEIKNNCLLKVSYQGNKINVNMEPQATSGESSSSMSSSKPSTSGSRTHDKHGEHSLSKSSVPLLENISKLKSVEINERRVQLFKSQTKMSLTSTTRRHKHMKRNQFRRLSVSMVIICIWCCIFNVPCSLYLFYVAFIAENRLQANFSTMGVIYTTLLVINVLGDPFIYAWRFVQWRDLAKKFKRFCCHRQYF